MQFNMYLLKYIAQSLSYWNAFYLSFILKTIVAQLIAVLMFISLCIITGIIDLSDLLAKSNTYYSFNL